LISNLDFKKAQIAATELAANFEVEKQRYEFAKRSMAPRLAVAQTELDQAKAQADLHHSQVEWRSPANSGGCGPTCSRRY
jgi:hypothetical protein